MTGKLGRYLSSAGRVTFNIVLVGLFVDHMTLSQL